MEELEDRLKELKNGVQLQQRKNQELEELRSSLHQELSIYKSVCPARGGRGGLAAGEPGAPGPAHADGTGTGCGRGKSDPLPCSDVMESSVQNRSRGCLPRGRRGNLKKNISLGTHGRERRVLGWGTLLQMLFNRENLPANLHGCFHSRLLYYTAFKAPENALQFGDYFTCQTLHCCAFSAVHILKHFLELYCRCRIPFSPSPRTTGGHPHHQQLQFSFFH